MFHIVSFDITDDGVRTKIGKELESHGKRIQKSVFECPDISEEALLKLKAFIEDRIDHGTDTVMYYPLCKACIEKVEYSGTGKSPDGENFRVV